MILSVIREYGYPETLAKFDKIQSNLKNIEVYSLQSLFQLGEYVAKATVPYRTGNLYRSIGWNIFSQTSGEFFATADYAKRINGGTSKFQARPFFDLAVMEMSRAAPYALNQEAYLAVHIQDPHILNLRASKAYERLQRASFRAHGHGAGRRTTRYGGNVGISPGGSHTRRYPSRPSGIAGTAGVRRPTGQSVAFHRGYKGGRKR